ncbi:hypothetical protein ACTOB_001065 [Actinoplanes oblitus]|uniref:Lipoprotein n=1 Tax=Actinoplanes oblitus TaxID=3040509 RepID=A0ABY8WI22_9ACTN|nr:hypothetical protein [Actinoplanes oblitus]WIM97536.1 hypothetical protein ACTOB_001065 [Actinoplanes oblitus]
MTVLTKRLAAVAALMILGGCGQAAGPEAAKPAAPTPAEVLKKAVPSTATDVFHYAITGGVQTGSGVVDSAKKTMTIDVTQKEPDAGFTMTMKLLMVGDDAWAKISFGGDTTGLDLPALPKKWMKLDAAKLGADAQDMTYDGQIDPGNVSTLVDAAAGLTEKSPGHFAGTVDLTQAADADIVEAETLSALGDKARAVPFEATLDARGRVSTATVRVPAAGKSKALTYHVTYDQYDSARSPSAPTGSAQVKAPKAAYDLLNG